MTHLIKIVLKVPRLKSRWHLLRLSLASPSAPNRVVKAAEGEGRRRKSALVHHHHHTLVTAVTKILRPVHSGFAKTCWILTGRKGGGWGLPDFQEGF